MALFVEREERVPGDFPEMPVGIGEIARIAAPEHILQRLHGDGARSDRQGIDLVGLFFRARVVGERDGGKAGGLVLDAGILGKIGTAEQSRARGRSPERRRHSGWLAEEAFQPQAS